MILAWRLSTSLCENIFIVPSGSRTMMVLPTTCVTVPFLISVTVTGVTVVVVVIVAMPFMPGFNSLTDTIWPSTLNLKSAGTVNCFDLPSVPRRTSWLPSTEMTSNFFISVLVVVCAAAVLTNTPTRQMPSAAVSRLSRIGSLLVVTDLLNKLARARELRAGVIFQQVLGRRNWTLVLRLP